MSESTESLRRLALSHPIVQAPMAGGADTPALVAEVGRAGALGFVGAAYLSPEQIARAAADIRARTQRPFGINLFAPTPTPRAPDPQAIETALARVAPWFVELGLPPPEPPAHADAAAARAAFDGQLAAALQARPIAISFTFGLLPEDAMAAIRAQGVMAIGTATTVEEARLLERAGADAVVAQGAEAGGHRGSFAQPFERAMVGTIALVPQVVDAVRVPVLASGGIMDGRGIAAARALGAVAVQMGTAFLACAEAGIAPAYRAALAAACETDTDLTRAFSGRPARGVVNRFMHDAEDAALPFPLQNALTRPMRTAAARAGRAEMLSLWAGQGVPMLRRDHPPIGAAALVARLVAEMEAARA